MHNQSEIEKTLALWKSHWQPAKLEWNPLLRLQEPIWCLSNEEAVKEGLTGSFAMIRLTDHRIVINLEEIVQRGITDYATEVLAHEIGHHIFTPANLYDNAILLNRIRFALPGIEDRAPMVSNLYADFLINDKLQRIHKLRMSEVYQAINSEDTFSEFWTLMMRTYEYLWRLNRGELATNLSFHSKKIDSDASLLASLVRSYSKNWIHGGGRFAVMLYPYLMDDKTFQDSRKKILILLDAEDAGKGAMDIAGMTQLDLEGYDEVIDMRKEALSLKEEEDAKKKKQSLGIEKNRAGGEGPRKGYIGPGNYIDLMKQVNPNADEQRLVNAYYKEIALPHLIDFPVEISENVSLDLPEGLETWDIGDSIEEMDWLQSAILSPTLIPGLTTQKRTFGSDSDNSISKSPLNVYIGIDCSGSMMNPKQNFSWPVLAAAVIGLSALRAGAAVMGCLSGEPGDYLETDGFITDETDLLTTLTSYLGTGYAYGMERLRKPFEEKPNKKSHIVIVTDNDIFSMLDANTGTEQSHWELAEIALKNAGGHGTMVLHSQPDYHKDFVIRLEKMGWKVCYVTNEAELLKFALEFSQQNYAYV
ncbi:hypothetical protein D0809_09240 [Flavobacterium circumlabens]|uniref:VWA domain-containing protein n=1 Tax=Flavobacterium circumlabens TaxID=2133765 RepID=A0A4Y7UFV5_9FLAO|nr:hypothetical protein [Flavobacterium circumlabens]TCN60107.1 hypothetical protein EV142_102727 [Flavobacterium circumlabens]TEB45335.1 hypothetical protein D0809_09240 [Flavobacterium circumlabens]